MNAHQTSLPLCTVMGIALILGLLVPGCLDATETVDLAERIRDFRSATSGAAPDTRRRLLVELRDELADRRVRFRGTLTNFSSYGVPTAGGDEGPRGLTALSWEFQGRRLVPRGCESLGADECAELAAAKLRAALPGGPDATMIIVQRDGVLVYALTQDRQLVDSLRRGAEVEAVLRALGMFEQTLFTVLESAAPVVRELGCGEGHRFPADSGFSFCPKCGQPLEVRD